MKPSCYIFLFGVVLSIALPAAVFTQDAVPGEILGRTLLMRVGTLDGTAFTIDYKGKLYLVTARHMVAGLPTNGADIDIERNGVWTKYHITKILFPESNDVDIAVLATDEKVHKPYEVKIGEGKEGPTFGQVVWFLGYPYDLHTHVANGELPFIKRGTMSAIDGSNPKAEVIYIDGFNNSGFSGGPVLYWDFTSHAYRLIGVVQGFRDDHATVVVNGQHLPTPFVVNSGILIAYHIRHAVQAIMAQETGQR